MKDLPPRSSSRAVLIAALADLAREITGAYDPESRRETIEWIDDVQELLNGRSVAERAPRESMTQGCSNCGRAGHNRTTCTEPDKIAKVLAPTAHKKPPSVIVPQSGELMDDASRAVLGVAPGARWK